MEEEIFHTTKRLDVNTIIQLNLELFSIESLQGVAL